MEKALNQSLCFNLLTLLLKTCSYRVYSMIETMSRDKRTVYAIKMLMVCVVVSLGCYSNNIMDWGA